MAWARIQSCNAFGGSGNAVCGGSTTPPTPGWVQGLTAGSKLICYVSQDVNATGTISSVKDGSGNTFTQLALHDYGSTAGTLAMYAMDTPVGDVGTTPTITATLTSTFGWNILCQEISGLATGNTTAMLDGTPGVNTGTATPATNGAYSSSIANEYLVAVVGDPGFSATYTETGYTAEPNNLAPNGEAGLFIGYKNSAGTTESMSWAINMTTNWVTFLVAFKLFGGLPAAPGRQFPNRPLIQSFRSGQMGAAHSR